MFAHDCIRTLFVVAFSVSWTHATSVGHLANKMHIVAFTVDSSVVPVNATIVMRCSVADMDTSSFVRYLKVDRRNNRDVVLTTNTIKEDNIKVLDRYSIKTPEKNIWNGYDFILTIAEAQVADSGTYVCSIPQLDKGVQVEVSVINDPSSLELYIDNRLVAHQGEEIQFDDVTEHNVTCTASGGYPQPVLNLSLERLPLVSTTLSKCRVEEDDVSRGSFLNHVACTSTTSASGLVIDYVTSGSSLICSAMSPNSSSPPLTLGVVLVLPGGLPEITCDDTVTISEAHSKNVQVLCQITAFPPLTDAFIQWTDKGLLRPHEGKNGVKFARDEYRTAYLRPQGGNLSLLEMIMPRVHPKMLHSYHFVAVNAFGADGRFVTLKREAQIHAVHSGKRSSGMTNNRSDIVLVVSTFLFTTLSFVTSRRIW